MNLNDLCENNGFARGISAKRSSAIDGSLARRTVGYNIEWDFIHGDHGYEIRAKLKPTIERAYRDRRPTVLEIATCRFEEFTIADANKFRYRTKQEVEERRVNHDPLHLWITQLWRENLLDQKGLSRIRADAFAEAKDEADYAKASAFPAPAAIMDDIYWEVDHATAAGTTERNFFSP